MAVVYVPMFALQILLRIQAWTTSADEIKQRPLRMPERFRLLPFLGWSMVTARMKPVLTILLAIRLFLIVGIFYDLTAFQGHYLNLLINGIVPEISVGVAALLLPPGYLGLAAASAMYVQHTTGARAARYAQAVMDIVLV